MEKKRYTGVGSRKTPEPICSFVRSLASFLRTLEYTLRSGGANGADLAFENALGWQSSRKEIYLPWEKFNGSQSELFNTPDEAFVIAEQFYPRWNILSSGERSMMARNVCQVLGQSLDKPSRFLVCWTPKGRCVGGTAQAIRIAEFHEIPVFNLGNKNDYALVAHCLHKKKDLVKSEGMRFKKIRADAGVKKI